MNDIVDELRNVLSGASSFHPAVNVRVIPVGTLEAAIAEIEQVRAVAEKCADRWRKEG